VNPLYEADKVGVKGAVVKGEGGGHVSFYVFYKYINFK
jgi:hypothetical protein